MVTEQITSAYSPVEEMAVRTVQAEELVDAKGKLTDIEDDIEKADAALTEKLPLVTQLQKAVKELADQ